MRLVICIFVYPLFYYSITRSLNIIYTISLEATAHAQLSCARSSPSFRFSHIVSCFFSILLSVHSVRFRFYLFLVHATLFEKVTLSYNENHLCSVVSLSLSCFLLPVGLCIFQTMNNLLSVVYLLWIGILNTLTLTSWNSVHTLLCLYRLDFNLDSFFLSLGIMTFISFILFPQSHKIKICYWCLLTTRPFLDL
jgi:hypothetical protein